MKIGLFGGTFDPPHIAHLITAEYVRDTAQLDRILFIPSYISPHKRRGEESNAADRLEMTRRAIEGNPHFECSEYEVRKGAVSYTVETLEFLHAANPGAQLSMIIGMDNYLDLHTWKDSGRILELSDVIVMNRGGVDAGEPVGIAADRVRFVPVPDLDISSSGIRERIRNHQSVTYLVPSAVEQYIVAHHLYQELP
ncbi:MAG TPA: nicotinate-nucleotide adenylyltransferase [Bacteroidota bacterium]|nr:nicotinate-nucleotide adenylyltransferase [Bacteroidota bacterium]